MMKKFILATIIGLGILGGTLPVQASSCAEAVDANLIQRGVGWRERLIAKRHILYVISRRNSGHMSREASKIYLANILRRFSNDESWISWAVNQASQTVESLRGTSCVY
jgi:hypothetical protein